MWQELLEDQGSSSTVGERDRAIQLIGRAGQGSCKPPRAISVNNIGVSNDLCSTGVLMMWQRT